MLRKTLITLMAFAALGMGSAAMAMHGGGGGGGHGGGWGGGGGGHGWSGGGAGFATMHGAGMAPMMHAGRMVTAPMTGNFSRSNTALGVHDHFDHFHGRFHHRFHHRNFFAFGFGGPIYDYAYSSCWTQVPTRYGWRWVYVCGDYGY